MKYIFLLSVFIATTAHAASGIIYEGRLIKPDGTPLEAASVSMRVQLRSPGSENCLLFDESHAINMTGSNGMFSITIGTGTRVSPGVDGGYSLDRIFANRGSLTSLPSCSVGTSYSPNTSDSRNLVMQFNDGGGWQTLPTMAMGAAPQALEASQIAGYKKDQLLRVADGVTATEFSNANWTELWNLISGTSTIYQKADGSNFSPSASVSYNNQKIISLADPTAAQDAATKNYVDTRVGGKTVDVSTVSNVAGDGKVLVWNQTLNKFEAGIASDSTKLPLAGGTMTGAITMAGNNILAAGHIVQANQATLFLGKLTSTEEASLIAAPLNNTTDRGRTWYNTTTSKIRYWDGVSAQDVASSASAGDALTSNPLSQFAATTSAQLAGVVSNETGTGLLVFGSSPTLIAPNISSGLNITGSTSGGISLNVPAAGSVGTYTWPAAPPGSNMVLQSDNAGNLSWISSGAGGTVTSVTSANSDISVATVTTTPTLTLNTGTAANQIIKLDGSARIPAVDGSLITNLNASNFSSGTISPARLSPNVVSAQTTPT